MRGQTNYVNQEEQHETQGPVNKFNDGLYVNGYIEGVPVVFTADTGASKTVVSTEVFERIDRSRRPILSQAGGLKGAGGSMIKGRGKGSFSFSVGEYKTQVEAVVADIDDEALLGMDVLSGRTEGPADILMSKSQIIIDGVKIPCVHVREQQMTRRLIASDDVIVPVNSDAVIDVYVGSFEEDDADAVHCIIEPKSTFIETNHMMMASRLVDINQAPTCKVKVTSSNGRESLIEQNAVIGVAEEKARMVSLNAAERGTGLTDDMTWVRRVQMGVTTRGVSSIKALNKSHVTPHLQTLFETVTERVHEQQNGCEAELLIKHADTFSKDEWDIKLTYLAERSIDTGQGFIKQGPGQLAKRSVSQRPIDASSQLACPMPLCASLTMKGLVSPCMPGHTCGQCTDTEGCPDVEVQAIQIQC